MRKKYLSALLFGALLFASAGTFTSCKDYDDDINNLQGQIDDVNTAITELQNTVKGGKYVTAVSNTGNTITFTFSDGSTTQVALEDKVGSVVTVEGGVLYIDGEATEIKVAESTPGEPSEEHKDQIIIENNMWSVLQEDGTYKTTNIPVSGVSVSGSEADGYTFIVYENGKEPQTIKLPSASTSLVDINIVEENEFKSEVELINFGPFKYTGTSKWPGKELPSDGQVIIAQKDPILVQLNPTNVDGKDVKFSLIDSKRNAAGVNLVASDYTGLLSRAANANGLYSLQMKDVVVNNTTAAASYFTNFKADNEEKLYAVTAGYVLSEYGITCSGITSNDIDYLFDVKTASGKINTNELVLNHSTNNATVPTNPNNERLEMGQWYTVAADMATIYDLYLSISQDEKTLYGVEIKNEDGVYQFRYTKTPDNVSKPTINLVIQSVDKKGNYNKTTATFSLSEVVVSDAYVYDETAWTLVDYAAESGNNAYKSKNAFSVKMADMLNSFSTEDLALWNTKVKAFNVQLYDAETGKIVTKDRNGNDIAGLPGGMHVVFVDKDGNDLVEATKDKANEVGTAANIKKTATIALRFENTADLAAALSLNHKYKAVITFVGTASNEANSPLSTTEIPFTLSIPTIDKLFVEQAGVFVDGIANAYMDVKAEKNQTKPASYGFASAFNKFGSNMKATTFEFKLDEETKIIDNLTSSDLARIEKATETGASIVLSNGTNNNLVNSTTGLQKGYKQELIVNVSAKFAGVWDYGTATDVDYTFKIKVMSPLYEGKIVATEQVVTIPATDVNGHAVNSSDIEGYTYNDILYSIFPDTAKELGYKRDEIQKVEFASMDTNIFTCAEEATDYQPAGTDPEKKPARDGYLVVYPKNLAETTNAKLKVTLTDAWGYKKVAEIPVQVTVGK